MDDSLIALFEFEQAQDTVRIVIERHYRLVPFDHVSSADIEVYRGRLPAE
jgi:hypothetical protein